MRSIRKEILCLCRDQSTLYARRLLLEHFGYSVLATGSITQLQAVLRHACPDMVLLDTTDLALDCQEIAQQVKTVCPRILSVALTGEYGLMNDGSGSIDGFLQIDGPREEWQAGIASLFAQQAANTQAQIS